MTILGVSAVILTALASWADRRRQRRADLERVGFMPWPLLTIIGTITALFAFAFALRG